MTFIGGRGSEIFSVAAKTDAGIAEPPLLVDSNDSENDDKDEDEGGDGGLGGRSADTDEAEDGDGDGDKADGEDEHEKGEETKLLPPSPAFSSFDCIMRLKSTICFGGEAEGEEQG